MECFIRVSAINAKQLLVEFNRTVGNEATNTDSYNVNTIATASANNVLGAHVQADGKSVLLTLKDPYRVSTDVAVVVDGVYVGDSIKDKFPKFATTVTVHDTTAPEIVSASAKTTTNEAQSVNVALSEPITDDAIFKINGKTVTANPVTDIDVATAGVDAETVATNYVLSGVELETGKTHTVEIINAEDYAENKAEDILTKSFSVEKDTVEATGKAVPVQDNKIKVAFDKPVNEASLQNVQFFTYDGSTYTSQPFTSGVTKADKAGKEWIFELDNAGGFYTTNNSTQDVLVKVVPGVIDSSGNPVKPFEGTVQLTEDVTGPALESITYDANSKGEVSKLYFHFDELLDPASVDATIADTQIVVKNTANNNTVLFNDLFGAVTAELATDGKTVVATVPNPAASVTKGSYAFEVQTGANALVTDSAVGTNANQKVSKTVNFGAVANDVEVTSVVNSNTAPDDQEVVVTFDNGVTDTSAINPANYAFAGEALPKGTEIVYDKAALTATFTLPMDYIEETDTDATVVVKNIKPVDSSAKFTKYADVINVTDNTRPVPKPSIIGTGVIKLTFSEAVTAVAAADDIGKVIVNGLELDGAEYTVAGDTDADTANDILTITVDAKESLDHDGTGVSYQYIDVDNSGDFDPGEDIVLRKANSVTAPASWADDNGVAKLNLSTINSVKLVTANAPTTVTDLAGNTIKPNATITVK